MTSTAAVNVDVARLAHHCLTADREPNICMLVRDGSTTAAVRNDMLALFDANDVDHSTARSIKLKTGQRVVFVANITELRQEFNGTWEGRVLNADFIKLS